MTITTNTLTAEQTTAIIDTLTGRTATVEVGRSRITVSIDGGREWTGGNNRRIYLDIDATDARSSIREVFIVLAGGYRLYPNQIEIGTPFGTAVVTIGQFVTSHTARAAVYNAAVDLLAFTDLEVAAIEAIETAEPAAEEDAEEAAEELPELAGSDQLIEQAEPIRRDAIRRLNAFVAELRVRELHEKAALLSRRIATLVAQTDAGWWVDMGNIARRRSDWQRLADELAAKQAA